MRVLCVNRHEYLSEHLCRFFRDLGVQCECAVGLPAALALASTFEPQLLVVEGVLLTPAALESIASARALNDVPMLSVSLTPSPAGSEPGDLAGQPEVIYLPALTRDEALALLTAAQSSAGVDVPDDATLPGSRPSAAVR